MNKTIQYNHMPGFSNISLTNYKVGIKVNGLRDFYTHDCSFHDVDTAIEFTKTKNIYLERNIQSFSKPPSTPSKIAIFIRELFNAKK